MKENKKLCVMDTNTKTKTDVWRLQKKRQNSSGVLRNILEVKISNQDISEYLKAEKL
jgi:hypothetical protein